MEVWILTHNHQPVGKHYDSLQEAQADVTRAKWDYNPDFEVSTLEEGRSLHK